VILVLFGTLYLRKALIRGSAWREEKRFIYDGKRRAVESKAGNEARDIGQAAVLVHTKEDK
jgi:hypothetical protein